jgi:hypothetical protein
MGVGRQIGQYATRRVTRKLVRAVPWLGAVVALVTLGKSIRQKGWVGGTLDTALDFTPVVGTLKNVGEVVRGRDFIKDRPGALMNSQYGTAAPRDLPKG